jgi:sensor histidine kinase regulating citrate/malate metabolism
MTGSSFATRIGLLLTVLTVLACAMVTALNYLKFERLLVNQHQRIFATIGADLADTFERGMNIGVRLADVPGAQALLDRAFGRDADLRRITVADAGGRILFDTERVRIGKAAEAPLLPEGRQRRLARLGGLDWIGIPVVNSFGQAEGSLLLGYGRTGIHDRLIAIALAMAGPGLLALLVSLPLAWIGVVLAARPARRLFGLLGAVLAGGTAPPGDAPVLGGLHDAIHRHAATLDEAERQLEVIAARAPEHAA